MIWVLYGVTVGLLGAIIVTMGNMVDQERGRYTDMRLMYQAEKDMHAQERALLLDRIQAPEAAEVMAVGAGEGEVDYTDDRRTVELERLAAGDGSGSETSE